ncbi:hypothetical protein Tco_0240536 [Tanacetum coccineum]
MVHHQSYQAPAIQQPPQASFSQLDSGLVVLSFLPSDDPIASLNKAMAFISTTFTSHGSWETDSGKMLFAEALESGVALDEEHMAFLEDNEDTVTTGRLRKFPLQLFSKLMIWMLLTLFMMKL